MQMNLFAYIFKHTKAQQLYLSAVIWCYYPIYLFSLELPKRIINEAIGAEQAEGPHQVALLGINFTFNSDQVGLLIWLCAIYLVVVLLNGGIKYYINVYKGRMGERLLRRLRYELYQRILRFPFRHFRNVRQGEVIPMITAEVEPIGGFAGTAYADPQFMGGMLLIALGFIVWQDPILGAAALSLYPVQMYIIPKLQRQVNQRSKERVKNVRAMAGELDDSMTRMIDIRTNNTVRFELSRMAQRLGWIYAIRLDIYRKKFFIKFLNNFIDKLTPFFFFLIGGYLVILGRLDIGALVAVLSAYKDLAAPWKELLRWYQQKEDIKIKFEQVTIQFEPQGMVDGASQLAQPEYLESARVNAKQTGLQAERLALKDDQGQLVFDAISFELPQGKSGLIHFPHVAGRSELGLSLCGVFEPDQGQVSFASHNLVRLPEAVRANQMALVEHDGILLNATIGENINYGHYRIPVGDGAGPPFDRREALLSGNSTDPFSAAWTLSGAEGDFDEDIARQLAVIDHCQLSGDLFRFGLRSLPDFDRNPDLAERLLQAREGVQKALKLDDKRSLIAGFVDAHYNIYATVAENLMFGALRSHDAFDFVRPAEHPWVREVLVRTGLEQVLIDKGAQTAELMIELFADLSPGHPRFQKYNLVSSDELEECRPLVAKADTGQLDEGDKTRLITIAMRLVPAIHRLGLITEEVQEQILQARALFQSEMPEALADLFHPFDQSQINPAISIQDNILFGKLIRTLPNAEARMNEQLVQLLGEVGLKDEIIRAGLATQAGQKGRALNAVIRQKILLARA
ncbi:MAG: ABC transporter transmembrane domain-containing protein, partial [Pseudomonadota bacterium]